MDVLSRPAPKSDHRIPYGPKPSQFGDLWLPEATRGHRSPLIVFYHGGWWKSEYDLAYAGHLCQSLKQNGIATWSVEYRRVGEAGGGWPGTFEDAAAGFDHVTTLAQTYPLDLTRVATMGHSAGGHLAFWIAGRHHVPSAKSLSLPLDKELRPQSDVAILGTIALAGAVDLRMTIDLAGEGLFAHDKQEVYNLMEGSPQDVPERYGAGNPGDLLPFSVPQLLIQGTDDDQIPPQLPNNWVATAHKRGDTAVFVNIPGADHFDIVDPLQPAWGQVRQSILNVMHPAP